MTKLNYLIIASTLLLVFSCAKKPPQIISHQEIKESLSFDLDTPSNSHAISNDQDTIIALDHDIHILIPSNSF